MSELLKLCKELCDAQREARRLELEDAVRGLDQALYSVGVEIGRQISGSRRVEQKMKEQD